VDVNEAYLTMLEYSRENVIGRDSRDLNMHIDPDKRAEVFRTLHEQGKVTNIELSFRTKTGRVIEILSSIDRINLQGQEYSLSTNIDITQRKQDEAEIKQLNRELKAINECDQLLFTRMTNKLFYPTFAISCVHQQVTARLGVFGRARRSQISAPLSLVRR